MEWHRPNKLLAVQILTLIHFMFFKNFLCIFCCGVTLVAFLCPVYTVDRVHIRIFNLVFILHNIVLYVLQSF